VAGSETAKAGGGDREIMRELQPALVLAAVTIPAIPPSRRRTWAARS